MTMDYDEWARNLAPPESYARWDRNYAELTRILGEAFAQAAVGKGAERHANGNPFEKQPICAVTRAVGLGFPLGQVMKKAEEAGNMARRGDNGKAVHELLGAINYLAAAVLVLREGDA